MPVPLPNLDSFTVRVVNVAAAGTPVQGPTVTVPDGFALVVRLTPKDAATPKGFVAASSAEASGATADRRSTLQEGDSVSLLVTNMSAVWVDADENDVDFEFIVEQ